MDFSCKSETITRPDCKMASLQNLRLVWRLAYFCVLTYVVELQEWLTSHDFLWSNEAHPGVIVYKDLVSLIIKFNVIIFAILLFSGGSVVENFSDNYFYWFKLDLMPDFSKAWLVIYFTNEKIVGFNQFSHM